MGNVVLSADALQHDHPLVGKDHMIFEITILGPLVRY